MKDNKIWLVAPSALPGGASFGFVRLGVGFDLVGGGYFFRSFLIYAQLCMKYAQLRSIYAQLYAKYAQLRLTYAQLTNLQLASRYLLSLSVS
ncbi:hypothetical protein DP120_03355 [Planococcus halotolerans]|uniref:Uncharacterized protein n=1 Tax=Planococcus halotolerans TaxID=2233542 RepID=A0A365L7H5_9BACL|nr:hypothetical protein DP120_03355 [Planococcus halotolerans]